MRRLQPRPTFSICRTIAIALSLALHVALLVRLAMPPLGRNWSARVASPVYDGHPLQVYLDERSPAMVRNQTSTVVQPARLLRQPRRPPVSHAHAPAQRQVATPPPAQGRARALSTRVPATLDLRLSAQRPLAWLPKYASARLLPGRSMLPGRSHPVEHGLRFRFQPPQRELALRSLMNLVCGSLAVVADEPPPQRLRLGMTRHMLWLAKRAYHCH